MEGKPCCADEHADGKRSKIDRFLRGTIVGPTKVAPTYITSNAEVQRTTARTALERAVGGLPTRLFSTPSLPICLALLGFALRAFRLDHHVMWLDETFSVTAAAESFDAIIRLVSGGEPHPPLHFLELHWMISIVGPSAYAMRWPSVIASTLTVCVAYRLASDAFGHRAGLVAALLTATNPFAIWYAQEARSYAQVMLGVTLALAGLARLHRGSAMPAVIVSALGAMFALFSHYEAGPALTGVWVIALGLLVTQQCTVPRTVAFALGQAVALVPFAAWAFYARHVHAPHMDGHFTVTGALAETAVYTTAGPAILVDPAVGEWLTVVTFTTLTLALGWLLLRRGAPVVWFLFLVLLFVVPVTEMRLVPILTPLLGARFLSVFLPAYLVLVSGVVSFLWGRWAIPGGGVLVICLIDAVIGYYAYQYDSRYGKWYDFRPLAQYVRGHEQAGDTIVINSQRDHTFWYYYHLIDLGGLPTIAVPASRPTNDAEIAGAFERANQQYDRFWVPLDAERSWDDHRDAQSWLDQHEARVQAVVLAGLEMDLYESALGLLREDRRSIQVGFAQGVSLSAWTARGDVPRHGNMLIVLEWHAGGPVQPGYKVFVHVLDANGRLVGQHDGPPASGVYATSGWQRNEVIIDQHVVNLPSSLPSGNYRVTTGLYDPDTLRRLPVLQGPASSDEVTLGVVTWGG